jgi:hypothetical protein
MALRQLPEQVVVSDGTGELQAMPECGIILG